MVDLAEPATPLAISREEIKGACFARELTMFAESRREFRFNQRTVAFSDEVPAEQKTPFGRFEQVHVIEIWFRACFVCTRLF